MKKRIIALILALLILLTGCSNVVPSAASEVPEKPYSEETPLPSATWYKPPTTPQKEYDGENAAQDVISAIRQAENEIANGDYDGTLDDKVAEILAENEDYQNYIANKIEETEQTQTSHVQFCTPSINKPILSVYDDAEFELFRITIYYDSIPDWLYASVNIVDGNGNSPPSRFEEFDDSCGPYTEDEVNLLIPSEVLISFYFEISESAESEYGRLIYSEFPDESETWCTFDVVDWSFDEYIDETLHGEVMFDICAEFVPDSRYPGEDVEHNTFNYFFSAEITIERLGY